MTILKDILAELYGMFVADARLTMAILGVVALAAGLIDVGVVAPLIGGVVLLAGCLGIMIGSVLWSARQQRARPDF